MKKTFMLFVGISVAGASSALSGDLEQRIMQKIDRDHKAEVSGGAFAQRKAEAKSHYASEHQGGRAIASVAPEPVAESQSGDHGRDAKVAANGPNLKTVAQHPLAVRAAVARHESARKGSSKPSGSGGSGSGH